VRYGAAQELAGRTLALIAVHLHEAGSGVIVDGDVHELPASALDGVAPVASGAVPDTHDAPELLGVHVQQIACSSVLVAHEHCRGLERAQAR